MKKVHKYFSFFCRVDWSIHVYTTEKSLEKIPFSTICNSGWEFYAEHTLTISEGDIVPDEIGDLLYNLKARGYYIAKVSISSRPSK